ncbi:MAG: YqgE/AlgH family protein [Candidatus Mariimomonas ferrooxydans]
MRKKDVYISVRIIIIFIIILTGMVLFNAALSSQYTELMPSSFFAALPDLFLPEKKLSVGRFLVATKQIQGSFFSETVILLTRYDMRGAAGLIINRLTDVKLSAIFPKIDGILERKDTVFIGGPVAGDQMLMLIRSATKHERSHHLFKDIYISSSLELLQHMIRETSEGVVFRAYVGYAGWAAGQLDREISRGSWYVFHADAKTIFDKAPSKIWPELFRLGSAQYII